MPGSRLRTLAVAAATAAVLLAAAGCGGSGVSSPDAGQLASDVGALSCTGEDYYLVDRLDSSKARIYSCDMGGREICVIKENGVESDVTTEAKLVFQNMLGGSKPICVSG